MSRPKHRSALAADRLLAALILIGCLIFPLWIADAAAAPENGAVPSPRELQLEVWINGYSTNLIAPFVELPDAGLATARESLLELDLVLPGSGNADDQVRLDSIPGLKYRLDQSTQTVHLSVAEGLRRAKSYDARRSATPIEAGKADYSALVNYSLYASALQGLSATAQTGAFGGFNGVNASLNARAITPYGNFNQSGIVGTIPTYAGANVQSSLTDASGLRLDSSIVHVAPADFMTYRAGDTISGGLSWTQPIRFGGIQVQRNFATRPDIVTQALPSFSGSAAAPSSVDVFVNGVKTYSQQVAAGPFQLSNVPTIGGGEARVVVRDASGKEVETKSPFYSAPSLLKPGLYEASAEGGFARYNYGVTSNDYGTSPIGSISLRAGITDWLTAETHMEGGLGLANGGVGAVMNVADRAIVSTAISGSLKSANAGLQLFGSIDTQFGPVAIHAQSSRAIGKYADLSTVTARLRPTTADEEARGAAVGGVTQFIADYRPALSRDQITFSMPIEFDHSSLSATYVRSETEFGAVSQIASLTYSRPFIAKSNLFATAFANLDSLHSLGIYVGSSMPLGDVSVSASVNKSSAGTTASVDAAKPLGYEPGSWGYRVRDSEGYASDRSAALSYRSQKARLETTILQNENTVRETAEASGSIVAMGGGVFMANTIEDGFAVVNAGAPGVRVLSENRFAGETDEDGNLLLPDLRSNQKNNVSIDATNLSISAEVDHPNRQVVPAYKSGVAVNFKVKREGTSAIVILKRPDGSFVDAGSRGRIDGNAEQFLVGYDGQAFIKNLATRNTAVITIDKGECQAQFEFIPKADTQVVIGPVVCE